MSFSFSFLSFSFKLRERERETERERERVYKIWYKEKQSPKLLILFFDGVPLENLSSFTGYFSFIPKFYIPLSLSLSLSLSQFEGKRKKRKEERHLCSWTVHLLYIWHVESVYLCVVKDSCILMFPRGRSCYLPCLLRVGYVIFLFQLLFAFKVSNI